MTRAKPLPPDERRACLIAVTRTLLLERGHDITTRQVAEAAQVAEGTLFRVFATRRDLIAATIADELSPQRLTTHLSQVPQGENLDVTTNSCLTAVADYVTAVGRLIPRPTHDDDRVMSLVDSQWQERIHDLMGWMVERLAQHTDELQVTPVEFAHVIFTLAMGYSHHHCPASQPSLDTLTRLALDGARRKDRR